MKIPVRSRIQESGGERERERKRETGREGKGERKREKFITFSNFLK